jgi:hypothetical protein
MNEQRCRGSVFAQPEQIDDYIYNEAGESPETEPAAQ